jgi:hypothetical protein
MGNTTSQSGDGTAAAAPELSDEILGALERPEVDGARVAFLEYVGEVTGGKMFPTNYYDNVLAGAIRAVIARRAEEEKAETSEDTKAVGARRVAKMLGEVRRLLELYRAFVEALLPFQPDAATTACLAVVAGTGSPFSAPVAPGSVFYVAPGSGGYWVQSVAQVDAMYGPVVEAIENTLVTA